MRKIPKGHSTSRTVIDIMKQIFSEHGVPRVVRSDNGPHFDAQAFKDSAGQYDFKHTTSSPHYAQSNGFIEAQVKTVKKTLLKAKETKTDPNIALLCLRATPIDKGLPSPTELLLSQIPSKRTEKEKSHFRVKCQKLQKPANRNHAKIRNHRRTSS